MAEVALPPHFPAVRESPWRSLSVAWGLIKSAAQAWERDDVMRLSAAVAMYAMLSLAPLLVITIKVTALVLDEASAQKQVQRQVDTFLGPAGAKAANDMVTHAMRPESGVLATVLSLIVLLYTASGVFNELRDSFNAIWGLDTSPTGGWWTLIRRKLLSFGLVLTVGFLLLVSMAVSTVLTVLSESVLGASGWVGVAIDAAVSILVVALLFATLFRVLPDAELSWRDVLFGSLVTAGLFKFGQLVLSLYFTYGSTASAYGAAGSFMVILLWVYYSCWILFFGAELVQEFAHLEGRRIEPSETGQHAQAENLRRKGAAVGDASNQAKH